MATAAIMFALAMLAISATNSVDEKLMLILIDGLRWDYSEVHKDIELPGFNRIHTEGVKADYIISSYPTVSYPNYFSILSGRYVESHGVVGNYMHDVKHNTTFTLFSKEKVQYESYWYNGSEPIWVTAEKQNLRTSWYYWLGTNISINGVKAFHVTPYGDREPTLEEMENAFNSSLLDLKDRSVNIVGVHVHAIDEDSHRYGFNSSAVKQNIKDVDEMLVNLQTKFDENGLSDKVNLMVLSDHGHVWVERDKLVNISETVDSEDIEIWLDGGALMYIWPKDGKMDKVYGDLQSLNNTHLHVYRREEMPDRLHLKNNPRMSPIFIMTDLPWYIITADKDVNTLPASIHGYVNQEEKMRAMFAAKGPGIKSNVEMKPFENVCLYNVMCRLLNLEPKANNGSWAAVEDMLSAAAGIYGTETIVMNLLTFLMLICISF